MSETRIVPAEPTMGQWDDVCKVFPIPFDAFVAVYKTIVDAAPHTQQCTLDGGDCGVGGYCDEHPPRDARIAGIFKEIANNIKTLAARCAELEGNRP